MQSIYKFLLTPRPTRDLKRAVVAGFTALIALAGALALTPTPVSAQTVDRYWATSTPLPDGRLLIVGGLDYYGSPIGDVEIFDPVMQAYTEAAPLPQPVFLHTATTLLNGTVMVAGGYNGAGTTNAVEIYNPLTNTWTAGPPLNYARFKHTATLQMSTGKVLITGGVGATGALQSYEVYDPVAKTWSTGQMNYARYEHTATLLRDQTSILIAGGFNDQIPPSPRSDAEVWNGTSFSMTGGGMTAHAQASATQLANGNILLAGGIQDSTGTTSANAELYSSGSNSWSSAAAMPTPHAYHSALLMPNGQVLLSGGYGNNFSAPVNLLPTPTGNATVDAGDSVGGDEITFSPDCPGPALCISPPLTVTGGEIASTMKGLQVTSNALMSGVITDGSLALTQGTVIITSGVFTFQNSGASTFNSNVAISQGLFGAAADFSLSNPGGYFVVSGTAPANSPIILGGNTFASLQATLYVQDIVYSDLMIYDPTGNTWSYITYPTSLITERYYHNSAILGNGTMLFIGGLSSAPNVLGADTPLIPGVGSFAATGLSLSRQFHGTTLQPNGTLLVTGGDTSATVPTNPTASYLILDAAGDSILSQGSMNVPHESHTSTLLPDGRTMVCGGYTAPDQTSTIVHSTSTCEIWNGSTWQLTPPMLTPRAHHTATMLFTGQVMVTGGVDNYGQPLSSVEIYDVFLSTWFHLSPLHFARYQHALTLLEDGRVLVTGGRQFEGNPLGTAEIYDPVASVWTTYQMSLPRYDHTATFLQNGEVLVAGGISLNGFPQNSTEIFNPSINSFGSGPTMTSTHAGHTGTLLPNGEVLIVGGSTGNDSTAATSVVEELNATNDLPVGNLNSARRDHTATLLSSGRLLILGGASGPNALQTGSSESAYFSQNSPPAALQPSITSLSVTTAAPGAVVTMNGTQFSGVSEGSAGMSFDNSASNLPRIILRPYDSGNYGTQAGSSYILDASTSIYAQATQPHIQNPATPGDQIQFTVPNTGCGTYQIAESGESHLSAFTTIKIQPPPVTSSPVVTGAALSATGVQFNFAVPNASNYYIYIASAPTLIDLWTSSTTTTLPNLSTNTPVGIVVRAENCISTSSLSQAVTVYTLAAIPVNAQVINVSSYSMVVSWAPNGNPADTTYNIAYSPDTFGTSGTTCPSNTTCTTTVANTLTLNKLTPSTTYFVAIQALNGSNIPTTFTAVISSATEPNVATNVLGTAAGISSVTWTWTGVPWATSYNLYDISGSTVTLLSNTTQFYYLQTGLSVNSTGQFAVQAALGPSVGPISSTATAITLAAAPTPHMVGATSLTATLYWDTDGNPPGTPYELSYSTDDFRLNVVNALSFTDDFTGSSFTVTGLTANTTYYFQMAAQNLAAIPSTSSVIVSTLTNINVPLNLAGTALGISSISWTWTGIPAALSYDVFEATSGATFLGNVTTTTFVETGLGVDQPGQIVSRARYASQIGPFSPSSPMVYTAAQVPSSSTVVFVTSTTVTADWAANGNPAGAVYTLQASPAADFSNGLLQFSTTALQYEISGLQALTPYYLRVDANNGNSIPTAFAGSISTTTTNGGIVHGTLSGTESTTLTANLNSSRIAKITVPGYAFSNNTQITIQDSSMTPCGAIPAAVLITVNPPQQPHETIQFSLSYLPSDIGNLDPQRLYLERWDPVTNTCSPLTSSVNTSTTPPVVSALLDHFSLYQIAYSTPAADLDSAHIWPNPLYVSRAGEAFFTVSPLPVGTDVQVFTLLGELVYKTNADASGTAQWPAVNRSGRRVASGVYLVLLKNGGSTRILKAAIER